MLEQKDSSRSRDKKIISIRYIEGKFEYWKEKKIYLLQRTYIYIYKFHDKKIKDAFHDIVTLVPVSLRGYM